jgi:hypothetical protein
MILGVPHDPRAGNLDLDPGHCRCDLDLCPPQIRRLIIGRKGITMSENVTPEETTPEPVTDQPTTVVNSPADHDQEPTIFVDTPADHDQDEGATPDGR